MPIFTRPKGEIRFQDLSAAKQPLPSIELDNEFNTVSDWLNNSASFTQNVSEWALHSLPPTYVSATQFTVPGNATDIFVAGRRMKINLNGNYVYSAIKTSSYSGASVKTTVTIKNAVLTNPITEVYYGFINTSKTIGSLPYIDVYVNLVVLKDYSDINDAIVAASGTTLVIDDVITLPAGDIVFPTGMSLMITQSGLISKGSATSLTILSPVVGAPSHQWLNGFAVGQVKFGSNTVVRPVWVGLKEGVSASASANYTALNVALNAFSTITGFGQGVVKVGRGIWPYDTTLSVPKGVLLMGENEVDTILWYTGTSTGIQTAGHYPKLKDFHLTSLNPETPGWMTSILAGIGTGQTGILLKHVNYKIRDVTISYFNKSTNGEEGIAIKTDGSNCFSGSIKDNYVRYCWGGISLEDTITDMSVIDNDIIDVTKFGVSIGYDWNNAVQTSFTGDNFRIHRNHIEGVNTGANEAATGNGYGIYLSRCAVTDIRGNYIESVYAQSGSIAYGIFGDGIVDGSYLLATEINNNNIVVGFSGTKYNVWIANAWYGGGSGNHFEGINGGVAQQSTSRWFHFHSNFFTGAPATPYSLGGQNSFAYDLTNQKLVASSDITGTSNFTYDFNIQLGRRIVNKVKVLSPQDSTPDVQNCNMLVTANTGATSITTFEYGSNGQVVTLMIDDANTTLVHSSGFLLAGGINWTPASGDSITMAKNSIGWREVSRSDNT